MNIPDNGTSNTESIDIQSLNTFIKAESCVLLLGPLFGLDKNGNKIHKGLKNYLESTYQVKLDQEFDNLCISKKSDGSENAKIMTGITSFFEQTERHQVYEQLIKIGFQSIISFSFETFLYEANKAVGGEYDFQYFNKKGSNSGQTNQAEEYVKKPIIYNVFGEKSDLNSLIVDYDSLYDFLLNMISADSQIPLHLKDIIGKANAFLFLGFDLSKWYIPILIRKLNQFISINRTRGSISGYACLDDTPDHPNVNSIDDLNKYPLRFIPFRHTGTADLIGKLVPRPTAKPEERAAPLKLTEEQIGFFKNWRQEITDKSASQLLDDFFSTYKKWGYSGQSRKEFEGQSMKYRDLQLKKNSQMLLDQEFNVGTTTVVHALNDIIDHILSEVHDN